MDFYVKNPKKKTKKKKTCDFHGIFLPNMLENDDSNLQKSLECISLQIFSNNPVLKAYPSPGEGGTFNIFRYN